jgi:DNA primase
VRSALSELNIPSYPKTSGSRGITEDFRISNVPPACAEAAIFSVGLRGGACN